ncbi:MAG: ATP-dependent RNA helicase HrpA [Acidobacteriota bacterium]|nr:ATP-dependent RNA helicase HrpA [Acidobacteriota bacterium]
MPGTWKRKLPKNGGSGDPSLGSSPKNIQAPGLSASSGTRRLDVAENLPIHAKREEIEDAIRSHRVVVVCGETGSGKTTQLPKICLAAGRGQRARIGHTQPRRIAARSVAERIAEEIGTPLGQDVGYKVRFDDRTRRSAAIKLMTDGILLAETQGDPLLREYDTLILDEAHERSLNIDFLLGYLHRLLERRDDLHLVITSATIDPDAFSRHFGDAPIVEVSGRTFPVEVRYRPLAQDAGDEDQERGIVAALEEVFATGPGDALVFLSGEREIRDTADVVSGHFGERLEVLPLFGRLAASDQHRIFRTGGRRRVILATNIAETSLTVPGIRFVVDAGRARISRFHPRTKVQRLPVEPISQASAAQRAGRCGRVADGICIRLYSEEDHDQREEFTPPEILRTNLAAVILQMKVMKLGDILEFPFVEPPETRAAREGVRLLRELLALDADEAPTPLGRRIARFPVDPRIAAILLAGHEEGCLEETLVVAAALSIPDPRVRPADKPDLADEAHQPWSDERSDFLGFLRLWNEIENQRRERTRNQFGRWCRKHYLSYPRIREWSELHRQLRRICARTRGIEVAKASSPVSDLDASQYAALHRALLTGLVANVAARAESGRGLDGTSGKKVFVFPGSGLFAKPPKWIVSAELVETSRLFARTCGRVEPAWIEKVGAHLVKRALSEPYWSAKAGRVEARERVTLGGLVLEPGRRIDYGQRQPERARSVFLDEALVGERLDSSAAFVSHNRSVLDEVERLEDRARRRGIYAGDGALRRFYDERLPEDVRDRRGLEKWLRNVKAESLHMSLEDITRTGHDALAAYDFPEVWPDGEHELELVYRFEPGHPNDGVTVRIPIPVLPALRSEPFEWIVPGYLPEKVEALLRTLPKSQRRRMLPLAEAVAAFLDQRQPEPSLHTSLRRFAQHRAGTELGADPFEPTRIPEHLLMRFEIVGTDGEVAGVGRDLGALRAELVDAAKAGLEEVAAPSGFGRKGLVAWNFGDLTQQLSVTSGGLDLPAYPALTAAAESVDLVLLSQADDAQRRTRLGVARLVLLALPEQTEVARRATSDELTLRYATLPAPPLAISAAGACATVADEIALAATMGLIDEPPRDAETFSELTAALRGRVWQEAARLAEEIGALLAKLAELRPGVAELHPRSRGDIDEQLLHLFFRGFVLSTPAPWRARLPHYLRGIELRIAKARDDRDRDLRRLDELEPTWRDFVEAARGRGQPDIEAAPWTDYRFRLEELRLSLFSQEVRTRGPVSLKRLEKARRALE